MALQSSFKTGPQGSVAKPRRFRSLASRLIAVGIGQVLLIALTAGVVFIVEGPREEGNPDSRIDSAEVARLEGMVDDHDMLAAALDELRGDRIEVTLYDEKHVLIASNVDPPLTFPERPPFAHDDGPLPRPDPRPRPRPRSRP